MCVCVCVSARVCVWDHIFTAYILYCYIFLNDNPKGDLNYDYDDGNNDD